MRADADAHAAHRLTGFHAKPRAVAVEAPAPELQLALPLLRVHRHALLWQTEVHVAAKLVVRKRPLGAHRREDCQSINGITSKQNKTKKKQNTVSGVDYATTIARDQNSNGLT